MTTPAEKAASVLLSDIHTCGSDYEDLLLGEPVEERVCRKVQAIIQAAIDESLPKWEGIESCPRDGTVIQLCSVSEDPSYCGHCVTAGFWDENAPNDDFNWVTFEDSDTHEILWNSSKMFNLWKPLSQPPEDAR